MVATVGSISIDLSTNASQFQNSFVKNAATVEAQSARMRKSIAAVEESTVLAGDKFKEFGLGLAAGTGLAAVLSLEAAFDKLKETISEYDAISKDAKTAGLKPDTFQALSFAAKQADIDQESFNSSLDIFAKNAGLAGRGTGALYSGLKTLNPQLLQAIINTKDQEERLKLVADAMKNTTDATQQAALATVIFGKGGVEMTRILEQGRASIDRFKKTAQDLGIIIPEELLTKAGELNDKLTVLGAVINHNIGEALINVAPLLVDATQGMANFSKEINGISQAITEFSANPSNQTFTDMLSKITGMSIIPGSLADGVRKALGDVGKTFDDLTTNTSDESTKAIVANIQFIQDQLAELKRAAAEGQDVKLETDQATAKLKALQDELAVTQAAGVTAANTISGQFAQAFRQAENASMDALAKMNKELAGASQLPTVHRYGGDPNKIELPQFNSQSNVNGSGVGVTSYGAPDPGFGYGQQTNVNGSGVNVRSYGADPSLKGIDTTAKYTQQTSDNVSTLDANTKKYLESLSSDIGGYSQAQIQAQSVTINKLSDLTAETFGMLPQALVAALAVQNDSASGGGADHMFGDAFDPRYGSYISSRGIQTARPMGHYKLAPTSSDGSFNTSVSVSQPGTTINLTYNAAAGESEATAKQRARDMYNELVRAQASA